MDMTADPIWYVFNESEMCSPKQPEYLMVKTLDTPSIKYVPELTCQIVKTWADSDYNEGWRYTCSECGYPVEVGECDPETGDVISAANFCWHCGARIEVSE